MIKQGRNTKRRLRRDNREVTTGDGYILRPVFGRFWHGGTTTSFFCRGSRCEMIPSAIKRSQARRKILVLGSSIRDLKTMHINREGRSVPSRQMIKRDENWRGRFVHNWGE
jgi:hypothetical protein